MNIDKTFGIISEGITDQVVLENILYGWTGNKNLSITRLQPKNNESGNWDKVFKKRNSIELFAPKNPSFAIFMQDIKEIIN